jgi:hypothetical protein
VRRWKRRARILGPFLGIPILLAALSLSVDWIEYTPQTPPDRLADRPIRMLSRHTTLAAAESDLVATAEIALTFSTAADRVLESGGDARDLNVILPSSTPLRRPTSPEPTRER